MKKVIAITCSTLLLFASLAHAQVVTIGTDKSYPPYHDIDKDGNLVGFEVDLAEQICKLANIECEFRFQEFSTLLSSVRFKKYDLAMAAFSDSIDRKRIVDFSTPYMDGGLRLTFNANLIKPESFCENCPVILDLANPKHDKLLLEAIKTTFKGKAISFSKNTIMDKYFDNHPELKRNIKIIYGKSPEEISAKLISGKVAIATGIKASEVTQKMPQSRVIIYGKEFGYGTAIVIHKENTELKKKINAAIKQLKADGTIKKLEEKWFEKD